MFSKGDELVKPNSGKIGNQAHEEESEEKGLLMVSSLSKCLMQKKNYKKEIN